MVSSAGAVTLENVHKLSLYELRQHLTKRGSWDLKDNEVSYSNALAKMVAVLHREKEEREAARDVERASNGLDPSENLAERLRREREERKRAALERSRARQAQAGYFEEKKRGACPTTEPYGNNRPSQAHPLSKVHQTLVDGTQNVEHEQTCAALPQGESVDDDRGEVDVDPFSIEFLETRQSKVTVKQCLQIVELPFSI